MIISGCDLSFFFVLLASISSVNINFNSFIDVLNNCYIKEMFRPDINQAIQPTNVKISVSIKTVN